MARGKSSKMPPAKYKIDYLPVADRDILDIISYITNELAAPEAASRLLDKIELAVERLRGFPYAHSIYPTEIDTRPFEIRAAFVESYVVLYYVIEETVTIARVVYGGRDIQRLLRWMHD